MRLTELIEKVAVRFKRQEAMGNTPWDIERTSPLCAQFQSDV